jgi:branched-chain amino acid transport system permease protein
MTAIDPTRADLPAVDPDPTVDLDLGDALTADDPTPEEVDDARSRPHRPSPLGWVARSAAWALLAWAVLAYPANALSPFTVSGVDANALSEAAVFAIIGLSLNVLIGYAGQLSLGHQAFVGIGAFTSAYVASQMGQELYLSAGVAALLGAAQAAVLGLISLRVSGLYFALVTLSYGVMAQDFLFQVNSLTGGSAGQDSPRPIGFETDHRYYYLCLAGLALVLFLDRRLTSSKGGRALLALRENPRVAATWGVNVKAYTVLAFVVAGGFAGFGGALFAHRNPTVVANTFDFQLALVFILMTVVGGLRNRLGVVLGAVFFALLRNGTLISVLRLGGPLGTIGITSEVAAVLLGPFLLLVVLTRLPGGFGQLASPIARWLRGDRLRFDVVEKEVQVNDVRA